VFVDSWCLQPVEASLITYLKEPLLNAILANEPILCNHFVSCSATPVRLRNVVPDVRCQRKPSVQIIH
jgi:hypothetical protein